MRTVVLLVACLLLVACRESAPALPLPDLSTAAPRAKAELEAAHAGVVANPMSASAWSRLAVMLLEHEFDDTAAEAYAIARELDPDSFLWPFAWGCRVAVTDPIAAAPILVEAETLRPDHVLLQVALGRTWDRAGDPAKAIAAYRRAVELDPSDPDARTGLARLLLDENAVDAARIELETALETNPTSRVALTSMAEVERRSGNTEKATEFATRADKALPAHDYYDLPLLAARVNAPGGQVILARARVMHGDGRTAAAEALLGDYVALNPDNPFAHISLGQFLVDLGRGGEGLASLYAAVGIQPDLIDTTLALADGLRMIGRVPEAAERYRGILAAHPKSIAARRGLAARNARLGKVDEAVAAFRELIAQDPEDVDSRFALAILEMQRGNFPGVVDALEPLIPPAREPADASALRAMSPLGLAYLQLGRMAEAADVLGRVVAADPSGLETRRGLAVALGGEGRGGEAVAVLHEGLEIHPGEPSLIFELAWLLATSPDDTVRDGEQAVHYAEQLAGGPGAGSPVALDVLACAYAEAGRFADAVAAEEDALARARGAAPPGMVIALERRLELFRGGMPYREQR